MIGTIAIPWGAATFIAALGEDLVWSFVGEPGPKLLLDTLNTLYGPSLEPSPALGRPGLLQLQAAARDLQGDLALSDEATEEGPAGRVY